MNRLCGKGKPDWKNVLPVGMGNRIKRDDGAGIYIAEQLKKQGLKETITAENSIENYIGKINRQNPATIVFIDSIYMENEQPGFFIMVPVREILNTTTNTHNLSIRTISAFFKTDDQWMLGIQPEDMSFGFGLSEKVKNAADTIIRLILQCCHSDQIILKNKK